MQVSKREEALAEELYAHDMGLHQGEYAPWDKQIPHVQDSYRRQAVKVVNSKWFKQQLANAHAPERSDGAARRGCVPGVHPWQEQRNQTLCWSGRKSGHPCDPLC